MTSLVINGYTIHPASQLEGGHLFAANASDTNYILLQSPHILNPSEHEQLHLLHVQVLEHLGSSTYLCHYEPSDLEAIRALPFITYANVYHRDLIIHSSLKDDNAALQPHTPTSNVALVVDNGQPHSGEAPSVQSSGQGPSTSQQAPHVHDDATCSVVVTLQPRSQLRPQDLKDHLVEQLHIDPDAIALDTRSVYTKMRPFEMEQVALLDEVGGIGKIPQSEFSIYKGRQVLNFEHLSGGNSRLTLFEYQTRQFVPTRVKLNGADYDGASEIVVVTDHGLDRGSTKPTELLPHFHGRVAALRELNRRAPGEADSPTLYQDDSGHGTHVAACVLGSSTSRDPEHPGVISGAAPKARLIVQAVDPDKNVLDIPPATVLAVAADPLAPKIFSNSWVSSSYDAYDNTSYSFGLDTFIANNPAVMAVWAAGNKGWTEAPAPRGAPVGAPRAAAPMIGSPSGSKNILTVGACENSHPMEFTDNYQVGQPRSQRWLGQSWTRQDYKFLSTEPGGFPSAVATFSNVGPTREGRFKPDVVGPGAVVYSARSQAVETLSFENMGTEPNLFGDSSADTNWIFMVGTSFATPQVAGSVAVLRSALKTARSFIPIDGPPAALVKALIINGAKDLYRDEPAVPVVALPRRKRGHPNTPAPNNYQGFGRVDIKKSLRNVVDCEHGGFYSLPDGAKHRTGMTVGPLRERKLTIPGGRPIPGRADLSVINLEVTLVYTDGAGTALQNIITLKVRSDDNRRWMWGNSVAWDAATHRRVVNTPANPGAADIVNNVQKVIWEAIPAGDYWIVLECTQILPAGTPWAPCSVAFMWDEVPTL